jgi:hypothetical protein
MPQDSLRWSLVLLTIENTATMAVWGTVSETATLPSLKAVFIESIIGLGSPQLSLPPKVGVQVRE